MVQIGSDAKRKQHDYKLSRYACYLIAQNGDKNKKTSKNRFKKKYEKTGN